MSNYLDTAFLLFRGCIYTLAIGTTSMVFGLILGSMIGTITSKHFPYRWLQKVGVSYVALIRGTPVFIQVLIIYFALPVIVRVNLSPITSGIIALSLNSSAYLSEHFRAGFNSIPNGQWEAAVILEYKPYQIYTYILYPQVFRNILPAITNELISLIKESSVLMIVGVPELTKVSRDIVSRELNPVQMYGLAALLYFIMTSLLSYLSRQLEKRRPYEY